QRFDRKNSAEELDYYGSHPDDLPSPDQYVGRPEPQSEPALEHVPTVKTLDYVKRSLDDLIERNTAPDGKVSNEGKGYVALKQKLVRGLAGDEVAGTPALSSDYKEALRISGNYLGHQGLFNEGKKAVLDGLMPIHRFEGRLEGLGQAEHYSFVEGMTQ